MLRSGLSLPEREAKPRLSGITALIDTGIPISQFKDTIKSFSDYIDWVKFGWGTSIVTPHLEEKISCLREHRVDFYFGGTLFEKYLHQNKLDAFHELCQVHQVSYVEISNGTVPISNREKSRYIREFGKSFTVISEVGHKDEARSGDQSSSEWTEAILEDLDAGAYKVITEARESGTSGICSTDGELRVEIIDEIRSSGICLDQLVFEAPNKKLQTYFIQLAGTGVNLGNIPFRDVLSLETLRIGLRSDTFFTFDKN